MNVMSNVEHLNGMSTAQQSSPKPASAATGWIVQKFGGTSLGKFPEEVANIIKYCNSLPEV